MLADQVRQIGAAVRRQLNRVRRRHWAYSGAFHGPDGAISPPAAWVLGDLARFCRAEESTFEADPRLHALLEGRREVFLHIMKSLRLDREAVARLSRQMEENDDE